MKQLITPNLNITYTGGWCERAVENTVGQTGIYPSAYRAWLSNIQHTNLPPKGFYVPVYLQLPNGPRFTTGPYKGELQGDVAISCPDGTIAAAALGGTPTGLYKYPSLQAYINDYARANNGAVYLGWGEYIGTIRVIDTQGDNMVTTKAQLDRLYLAVLTRPRGAGEGEDVYLGKDSGFVFDDLYKSAERATRLAAQAKTLKDEQNKSASLAKSVADLTNRLNEANKQITALQSTTTPTDGGFTDTDRQTLTGISGIVQSIKDILSKIFRS